MKLPDVNDDKELYLRAQSPANYNQKYMPKLPYDINISRLVTEQKEGSKKKVEFIPDYITNGLKNRHKTRFNEAQKHIDRIQYRLDEEMKIQ
jgi:hypothetical protein